MAHNSCRGAERAAKRAIMHLANAEHCTDDARLLALARLGELISGCMMEIESRRLAPPKTDPLVQVYI